MKKILIIEDDFTVSYKLKQLLDNAGYTGIILKNFDNCYEEIKKYKPDLILLDINIPNINGQQLLQIIRKDSQVPIIMVTSRTQETDEILSISFGADDYITKPYNPTILLLRINNIFKRLENKNVICTYKDLTIDIKRSSVKNNNAEVILTKNEMIIFNCLLNKQGEIVSRDEIITDLWSNSEFVNDNTLSVNIRRLRNKFEELGYKNIIETRKGIGYILL